MMAPPYFPAVGRRRQPMSDGVLSLVMEQGQMARVPLPGHAIHVAQQLIHLKDLSKNAAAPSAAQRPSPPDGVIGEHHRRRRTKALRRGMQGGGDAQAQCRP